MHSYAPSPSFCASDPVAVTVEQQLLNRRGEGSGQLIVNEERDGIRLAFGGSVVRAQSYDAALVRLADALLSDPYCAPALSSRLRDSVILEQIYQREFRSEKRA